MPSWCRNRVTVAAPSRAALDRFLAAARGSWPRYAPGGAEIEQRRRVEASGKRYRRPARRAMPLSFHALVPIPDAVLAGPYDDRARDTESRLWGVKWGAYKIKMERRGAASAVFEFETPYGPALTFWRRVATAWPVLRVAGTWSTQGDTRGRFVALDGGSPRRAPVVDAPPGPYDDPRADDDGNERPYPAAALARWRVSHDAWAAGALARRQETPR
jgi:hypothetical protein